MTSSAWSQNSVATGTANSILVKVNQTGSFTEPLDAVELAQTNKYTAVLLRRSGEKEDATIAYIAVATSCGQIKSGSLSLSDRGLSFPPPHVLGHVPVHGALPGKNVVCAGTSALPKGR